MPAQIEVGGIVLDVVLRDIKNVHLGVYPPNGKVRISAPLRMNFETISLFAISKLGWIRQQQKKLWAQERESQREYLDRESHYVWGRRYLLNVIEEAGAPSVQLQQNKLLLRVRPGTDATIRESVMADWYRQLVKLAVPPLIAKWEDRLNVRVNGFFVQKMKTKWGSCNPTARTIRFNTELARKPRECLDYIALHEIIHLLHPTHSPRFLTVMDQSMPNWRETRQLLNRLPARHEQWNY